MAGSYEGDLAEVEAELARLDGPALLAELRGHVAGWRAGEGSSAFFLPLPLVARDVPSVAGAWTEPGDVFRHELVGLDDRGRPVLHLL